MLQKAEAAPVMLQKGERIMLREAVEGRGPEGKVTTHHDPIESRLGEKGCGKIRQIDIGRGAVLEV